MSPQLSAPLTPDIRGLQARAACRGTSVDREVSEFIQRETGGVRPDALAALDARQSKLEGQLAQIETDRQRQLGIAAAFHRLVTERDRLAKQLATAREKIGMHRGAAAESLQNAKSYIGDTHEQWGLAGNLIWDSLAQNQIADALTPLVDAMAAELTAAEEAVLAYGREHGIATVPIKP